MVIDIPAGGGRESALPLLPAGGRIKPKYYG